MKRKLAMTIACLIVVLLLICIYMMRKNAHKVESIDNVSQEEIFEDTNEVME